MDRDDAPLMHPAHGRVWALLPWYLNASLDAEEHDAVHRHLGECLVCRRELARLEQLAAAVRVPSSEHASAQSYARLAQQILEADVTHAWPQQIARLFSAVFEPGPLVAGAALLVMSSIVVGMIVMSGDHGTRPSEQPFQTLGQQRLEESPISHPLVRVVLRDDAGEVGLDAWLTRHTAELVDGPSAIGVLTVRVAMGTRTFDTVLDDIRADSETLFVEPIKLIGTRPDRQR